MNNKPLKNHRRTFVYLNITLEIVIMGRIHVHLYKLNAGLLTFREWDPAASHRQRSLWDWEERCSCRELFWEPQAWDWQRHRGDYVLM